MLIVLHILIWIQSVRIVFHTEILGIRLANNVELEGKLELLVEVEHGGEQEWLAVCYEGVRWHGIEWNNQAAWVACRQLGYDGGMAEFIYGYRDPDEKRVNNIMCEDGKILYDLTLSGA